MFALATLRSSDLILSLQHQDWGFFAGLAPCENLTLVNCCLEFAWFQYHGTL